MLLLHYCNLLSKNGGTTMPQEITRTQIEKYTVYTGPTAESFSPIMAGITYPDPAWFIADPCVCLNTF